MSQKILVINAGSSTIKWTLFEKEGYKDIANGIAERIGVDGVLEMKIGEKKFRKESKMNTHKDAVQEILKTWEDASLIENPLEVKNIGFRIVAGGTYFTKPALLTDENIEKVADAGKFAPLHNPGAVQAMKSFKEIMPHAILTGSFDTAFHTTIPAFNSTYAIDKKISDKLQVKKYGAHGISHMYITKRMEEILGKEKVNFVNLHIGNGASLCAIQDSKAFDTSMGLTPLAGIMMGTRSGDIDPSIHQFIMKETGMSIEEMTNMLNRESGLKGVSGISQDMRDITKAVKEGHEGAKLAYKMYVQRIVDYAASYINKIEDPEAIVFTAGIGENSVSVRKDVCDKLSKFGIKIDVEKNDDTSYEDYKLISTDDSKIKVYVMRTNEELMIAHEAIEIGK